MFRASQAFFSIAGGMFVGLFAVAMVALQQAADNIKNSQDDHATMVIIGLAAGSFLGGLIARRGGAKTGATAFGGLLIGALFVLAFMDRPEGIEPGAIIGGGAMICATVGAFFGSIGMGQQEA